jgi:hypothetical protein
MQLIENVNPKKNPWTSGIGIVIMLISVFMILIEHVLPAFITLKEKMSYGYVTYIIAFFGLLLFFMNDSYFSRIFNRAEKITSNKTGTPND